MTNANAANASNEQITYLQSDIGISAFLMTKGFKLLGLRKNGNVQHFAFADPDSSAEQIALSYLQNEPIPARTFWDASKTLKTLLYHVKNNSQTFKNSTSTSKGANRDKSF